jgi:imidazolonepropionase-like amidohydrolase
MTMLPLRETVLSRRRFCTLVGAGLATAAGSRPSAAAPAFSTLAIEADTILPISGPPITNGVVLVRGGKITAIGTRLSIPANARRLHARVAMPGLIDAHAYLGCYYETSEPVDAVTPDLRIADAFDATDPLLKQALRAGVTTVCIMPGNGNALGGQAALLHLGLSPEIVRRAAGQKLSISADATDASRNPTSRAGVVALIQAALDGARKGKAVSSTTQTSSLAGYPTTLDERVRALIPLLRRDEIAYMHTPTADDIENALQLLDTYHLRGCLLHAEEAAEVSDQIRKRGVPVILGPLDFADTDRVLTNPGRLAKAAIKVAFCTDAPLADPASLRLTAHLAVRYGMSADHALRALTLNAAQILGIGSRVGSLEPGKDADILLLDGPPLELTSRIETVLSAGQIMRKADNDAL